MEIKEKVIRKICENISDYNFLYVGEDEKREAAWERTTGRRVAGVKVRAEGMACGAFTLKKKKGQYGQER